MSTLSFPTALAPTNVLPFQLLEINLISAQDLARIGRGMRTYAVAWVHPERKLSTRIDTHGHTDPTWNDKFVFRVDDAFLHSDMSAVMIEIYAVRCFRDVCVGVVRVLVGNLIPPLSRNQNNSGMRFVALQVRRPSGRPQGILNIGVALLDGSMRSMPLYTQLSSSAVGYRDLMGEESHSPNHHHHHNHQKDHKKGFHIRRSVSERRSEVTSNDFPPKRGSTVNGSEIGEPPLATVTTTGSIWSMSDVGPAPSVVAAGMTEDQLYPVAEVVGSNNVLEDWEAEASVEGLRSKLERWRTELPPIYDRGRGTYKSNGERPRRHTDGGGGLLSCFGDMYGFECSISCGLKPRGKGKTGKNRLSNFDDDASQSYMP